MEKYKNILKKIGWDKSIKFSNQLFGKYKIDAREIFIVSKYSYGFVNNKPLLPGHVLLTTKKVKASYNDLEIEEIIDLNLLANFINHVMGKIHNTTSLSIAIQDGKGAGQTVEHVHIHIIPRHASDYKNNDNIYKDLNAVNLGYGRDILCDNCNKLINVPSEMVVQQNFKLEEFNISIRPLDEMEKEACMIKSYIEDNFAT
ncbi:histidine triad protein, putative [Hepatocystis sp. ex Piliocolobus tephrosceles]|nr:histidine triad protein, putative [Hepatocystis sp. ex Piliocolobus tephrosceles]